MILQKLIYEHEGFKGWLQKERTLRGIPIVNKALITYEFVFAASCQTDDPDLKNVAPDNIELETLGSLEDAKKKHYKSRMGWIGAVAEDFHDKMMNRQEYMESELQTIAGWVDEPDHSWSCLSPYTGNFE